MEIEIEVWLRDILKAVEEINEFLPEKRDFFEFQKDLKTRKAVERNIEIIGEATHRILRMKPDYPLSNARKIVDTRNRIIHGYDAISEDIIWRIVVKDLPLLEAEIRKLLN
ncbi:MAG: DUF86 domain-containing protein [Flavobacteriales bacterium]|jgi:uncharacterized protein with HEPN domain|nr:DUF86 domain-containing protein [Flavobacteriales bacterium]